MPHLRWECCIRLSHSTVRLDPAQWSRLSLPLSSVHSASRTLASPQEAGACQVRQVPQIPPSPPRSPKSVPTCTLTLDSTSHAVPPLQSLKDEERDGESKG